MRVVLIVLLVALVGLAPASAQEEGPGVIATAYQTVNVRSGPGARYAIVGQLEAGEQVPVEARDTADGGWLRVVLADGQRGWVAVFSVSLAGDVAALPTPTAAEATTEPDGVSVTAYGRINVRRGPDILYAVIGQLQAGDVVAVSARSSERNDWLYIDGPDLSGWVAYFTVTVSGDPDRLPIRAPDPGGAGLVPPSELARARFNVRLRDAPSVAADVLTVVPFNAPVTPLQRSPDDRWLHVMYEDTSGWALARLFDLSADGIAALPVADGLPEITPEATAETTPEATEEE